MLPIAYTVSPYITRYLGKIEIARRNILLHPIPPKRELSLLFQTSVQRIHYGLEVSGQTLKQETITTILSNQIVITSQKNRDRYGKIQNTVINYKLALDFVKRTWTLEPQAITVNDLQDIYAFLSDEKIPTAENDLQNILAYLQSTSDNPFILSALAKLEFRRILPMTEVNDIFSTLIAYLFIYKGGMDCRGFILLEKPWSDDKRIFLGQYQTALNKSNITNWIEYYVKQIAIQLETTYQIITLPPTTTDDDKIGNLNERQKTIITLLEDPHAIITNRTIQKIFHISQITASRDLTKLTMLGLLYSHGKGRSVRYTKV